jgi:hypothetical protein
MALKKKSNPIKRVPLLPKVADGRLAVSEDGLWIASAGAIQPLTEVSKAIDVTPNEILEATSTPDVLAQSIMFTSNITLNAAAVQPDERQTCQAIIDKCRYEWLGALAAVLLADQSLMVDTLDFHDYLSNSTTSVFLRTLAQSCMEQRPPIEKFRVYSLPIQNGIDFVPIAFSYPGMPTILCPAIEIADEPKNRPQWLAYDQQKGAYAFGNPLDTLCEPQYLESAKILYELLGAYRVKLAAEGGVYATMAQVVAVCENELFSRLSQRLGGAIVIDRRHWEDLFWEAYRQTDPADQTAALMDSFFSERLQLIPRMGGGSVYSNAYGFRGIAGDSDYDAVLPLNGTFISYFMNENGIQSLETFLANNITASRLSKDSHDIYEITIHWNGKDYYKVYQGDKVEKLPNTPIMSVWPSMDDSQNYWKKYYVYYAMEDAHLPWDLKIIDRSGNLPDTMDCYQRSSFGCCDRVMQSSGFPRMIQVLDKGSQAELGLIAVKPAGFVSGQAGQGKRYVGLDFGTSNTIAYWRDADNNNPAPNEFVPSDDVLSVIRVSDPASVTIKSINFIGMPDHVNPVMSTMLFRHAANSGQRIAIRAILDGNIVFANPADLNSIMWDYFTMNLKWNNDQDTRACSYAYLEQFLTMCLWEAYKASKARIHWRFSYPRALSANLFTIFQNNLMQILNSLTAMDPNTFQFSHHFYTEGEAIGGFATSPAIIARMQQNGNQVVVNDYGFMSIDIGGGTVDLSLWQNGILCNDSSLREVAGNTVLCQTVTGEMQTGQKPRYDMMREVFGKQNAGSQTQIGAMLEILTQLNDRNNIPKDKASMFKQFKTLWALSIDKTAAKMNEHIGLNGAGGKLMSYLCMIETYLAMIFFYAGLSLGIAINEGRFSLVSSHGFSVLLSGNGSKMAELLCYETQPFTQSRLYQRFCGMFTQGCYAALSNKELVKDFRLQIIRPFMAKHEVAYGLATLTAQAAVSQEAQSGLVLFDQLDQYTVPRSGEDDSMLVKPGEDQLILNYWSIFWKSLRSTLLSFPHTALNDDHTTSFIQFISQVYPDVVSGAANDNEAQSRILNWSERHIHALSGQNNYADDDKYDNTMAGRFAKSIKTFISLASEQ